MRNFLCVTMLLHALSPVVQGHGWGLWTSAQYISKQAEMITNSKIATTIAPYVGSLVQKGVAVVVISQALYKISPSPSDRHILINIQNDMKTASLVNPEYHTDDAQPEYGPVYSIKQGEKALIQFIWSTYNFLPGVSGGNLTYNIEDTNLKIVVRWKVSSTKEFGFRIYEDKGLKSTEITEVYPAEGKYRTFEYEGIIARGIMTKNKNPRIDIIITNSPQ